MYYLYEFCDNAILNEFTIFIVYVPTEALIRYLGFPIDDLNPFIMSKMSLTEVNLRQLISFISQFLLYFHL